MYNDTHRLADSYPELFSTNPELTYAGSPYLCRSVGNGSKTYRIRESFQTGMTVPSLHGTIKENVKEVTVVSYVGILRSDEGIMGFSDSRCSYQNDGVCQYVADDVKKVFKGENFVIATYGANIVYGEDQKPERLEKVLDRVLSGFSGTHREFFQKLLIAMRAHFSSHLNDQFHFLIGFRDYDGLFGTEECRISRLGVEYSGPSYESGYRTGGYQYFGPKDLIIPSNLSVERMRKLAEVIVDSTERMGNLCLDYNPVGGKVQIEELHRKERRMGR